MNDIRYTVVVTATSTFDVIEFETELANLARTVAGANVVRVSPAAYADAPGVNGARTAHNEARSTDV